MEHILEPILERTETKCRKKIENITEKETKENSLRQDEISESIKIIKTGKSGGRDGIASELIKWGDEEMEGWIELLFRKAERKQNTERMGDECDNTDT